MNNARRGLPLRLALGCLIRTRLAAASIWLGGSVLLGYWGRAGAAANSRHLVAVTERTL